MANPAQDMRLYQVRLDTFGPDANPSKKRRSSGGGAITKSWPHATPTPGDLAFAGFYFNPTSRTEDNVNCFHCQVKLDGWQDDDVPISEHLAHSPDCAWALCTSVTLGNEDRDPMSDQMLKARIATFGNSWPYEKKRGWKCKTKKLAEAGWCMDPSLADEDGTTCFYCNLSLDGWEPKDDPTEEHRRRQPDCPFFALVEKHALSRPKKSRARASTASKVSRLSIQSTFSEAPSFMSLGDPEPTLEGDTSIASVMSTASTTKGRKVGAPKKATRSKKKVAAAPSVDDTDMVTALEDTMPVVELSVQDVEEEHSELPKAQATKKTTKAKGRPKKTQATMTDTQVTQAESQPAVDDVDDVEEKKPASKAKRGKKRTSDGEEKIEPMVVAVEIPASETSLAPPKKTKGTKAKKAKTVASDGLQESQVMDVDLPTPEPELVSVVEEEAPKPKKGRKPKAAKAKKAPTPEPEPEPVYEPEPEPIREPSAEADMEENDENDESGNFVVHAADDDDDEPNFVVHDQSQEFEPSPTPHKPAGVRSATPKAAIISKANTPLSARSNASDAENHPPSSLAPQTMTKTIPTLAPAAASPPALAAFTSPTKTIRIPLATQTPNRPSPHKLGTLKSSNPWTATDIETVFLASDARGDKDVAAQLAQLGGKLSSPEQKMTVEEWVRFQAKRGEEKLRDECEKMVWVFEKEGTRALGVLGGLEVSG